MKTPILKSFLLICTILISISIFAQTRQLDEFSSVRVSGGIKVEMIPSSDSKAEIDMIKGDYDDLITEVRNDVLHIKFKSNFLNWGGNNSQARVTLYYSNQIDVLKASAGSSVTAKETIESNDFSLDVSSGASASVVVRATDVSIDVSSGSSATVSGSTHKLEVDASSGARFNGESLKAKHVNVDTSSGSSAIVWASDRIVADASSGSSIKYKGNPSDKEIDAGKYSGGSVKAIGN